MQILFEHTRWPSYICWYSTLAILNQWAREQRPQSNMWAAEAVVAHWEALDGLIAIINFILIYKSGYFYYPCVEYFMEIKKRILRKYDSNN